MKRYILSRSYFLRTASAIVLLVVIGMAVKITGGAVIQEMFMALVHWIQIQGGVGMFLIIGLQALATVLVIPGPLFTAASGFLFGMGTGLVVAVAGSTVGAAIAYGIARALPDAKSLERLLQRRPLLRRVDTFARVGGWKVVCATRLIPGFPFKLSNYFFGWTHFPFKAFLFGTLIGIVPTTLVSVSLGALASDMRTLFSPEAGEGRVWLWSLTGLLIALCFLLYTGWRAKRSFQNADRENEERAEV